MVELAHVTSVIAAPADQIWEVLTDFAHPQRLAKSIEHCEVSGEGIGAVRTVTVRSLTIHERLEEMDAAAYRLGYRALATADMPFAGVKSYLATVTLQREAVDSTKIEWRSEGDIDGAPEIIEAHFSALYERAIDNLRAEIEPPSSDHRIDRVQIECPSICGRTRMRSG